MERLLMYVEDPGAANFVMPLLPELPRAGWQSFLYANGLALPYLAERGCTANELDSGMTATALIDELAPDVVMVGTSENVDSRAFELTSVAAAKSMISVAVVDGPENAENRFRGRSDTPLHHAPDWLFLTDEWTRDLYAGIGFPGERLVVTGHPYYDLIRQEGDRLRGQGRAHYRSEYFSAAPEERKIVVFLTEPQQGIGIEHKRRTPDYSLKGRGASDLRTHIVMEEFLDAVSGLDEQPYLVLRLHPKDSPGAYQDYLSRFDAISSNGLPLPQLFAADLVVGMTSSLLVEAQLTGLNTFSILPKDAERDMIMTVRDGLTPCATTPETVKSMLHGLLAGNPPPVDTGPGDRYSAVSRVIEALARFH